MMKKNKLQKILFSKELLKATKEVQKEWIQELGLENLDQTEIVDINEYTPGKALNMGISKAINNVFSSGPGGKKKKKFWVFLGFFSHTKYKGNRFFEVFLRSFWVFFGCFSAVVRSVVWV